MIERNDSQLETKGTLSTDGSERRTLDVTSFARASLQMGKAMVGSQHRRSQCFASRSDSQLLLSEGSLLLLLLHLLHGHLHADGASKDAPSLLDDRALLLHLAEESSAEPSLRLEERGRLGDVHRPDRVQELEVRHKEKHTSATSDAFRLGEPTGPHCDLYADVPRFQTTRA